MSMYDVDDVDGEDRPRRTLRRWLYDEVWTLPGMPRYLRLVGGWTVLCFWVTSATGWWWVFSLLHTPGLILIGRITRTLDRWEHLLEHDPTYQRDVVDR